MRAWHRFRVVLGHPVVILPYLERARDRLLIDRRYGFPKQEAGVISLAALGHEAPDRNSYGPSSWGSLSRILPSSEINAADVFIDFGCGMGRVVLEAARYPFRRVIGVEVAPQLTEVARHVIERNVARLRCQHIQLITADAVTYEFPDDVTVAYFANPFTGQAFQSVLDRLIASVDRAPRRLRIIYLEPIETARLSANERLRLVRYWRRGLRVWEPRDWISLYEVLPRGRDAEGSNARCAR
jgi:SAM-dependent methyltransferase